MPTSESGETPHRSSLTELMDDPIIELMLQGDGVSRTELTTMLDDMRHKLHLDQPDAPVPKTPA